MRTASRHLSSWGPVTCYPLPSAQRHHAFFPVSREPEEFHFLCPVKKKDFFHGYRLFDRDGDQREEKERTNLALERLRIKRVDNINSMTQNCELFVLSLLFSFPSLQDYNRKLGAVIQQRQFKRTSFSIYFLRKLVR
jgi:hypothetical protein